MALIKCSNCGGEISSNADSCIHCGKKLDNTIKTKSVITDYETEDNINTLNRLSSVLNIVLFIVGIIFFFVGMVMEEALVVCLSIICAVISFILPTFIRWKALMLKNIYEINRKK